MTRRHGKSGVRGSEPPPVYGVDPNAWFVSIYCAAASHPEDPWRIATLYVPTDEDWPRWDDGSPRWMEARGAYWTGKGDVLRLGTAGAGTALVGNRPENDRIALDVPDARRSYTFRCHKCGDSISKRAERLDPALSLLATVGAKEVPMPALRDALRRTEHA